MNWLKIAPSFLFVLSLIATSTGAGQQVDSVENRLDDGRPSRIKYESARVSLISQDTGLAILAPMLPDESRSSLAIMILKFYANFTAVRNT